MLLSGLGKKFALVLIFILSVSGLLLVESCVAPVTMPEHPSAAPEIVSVILYNNPVISPPMYTTDPFTGETYQTFPGGYIAPRGNVTIQVRNPFFEPYTDENGNYINIYYVCYWRHTDTQLDWSSNLLTSTRYVVYQSGSVYTDIVFTYGLEGMIGVRTEHFDNCEIVDFRIQAVTGYFKQGVVYEGKGSEWTEFTVTIPTSDDHGISKPTIRPTSIGPSISNSNNSSQQNSSQSTLIVALIVSVCIITILLAVITYQHKQRKTMSLPTQTQPQ